MNFKIQTQTQDNIHIAKITGTLDTLDAIKIPRAILPFTKKKFGKVVVDLSDTTFLDSQWLALFIRFNELVLEHGNELAFLIQNNSAVEDLLISTSLNKVFKVINKIEDFI